MLFFHYPTFKCQHTAGLSPESSSLCTVFSNDYDLFPSISCHPDVTTIKFTSPVLTPFLTFRFMCQIACLTSPPMSTGLLKHTMVKAELLIFHFINSFFQSSPILESGTILESEPASKWSSWKPVIPSWLIPLQYQNIHLWRSGCSPLSWSIPAKGFPWFDSCP